MATEVPRVQLLALHTVDMHSSPQAAAEAGCIAQTFPGTAVLATPPRRRQAPTSWSPTTIPTPLLRT